MTQKIWDCVVIGGGPAGLTAAIYLARFHLTVTVIDAGQSRAALIPLTRNHAGFPEGISGSELLAKMRRQANNYGAEFRAASVTTLAKTTEGFAAQIEDGTVSGRTVLLATGVINHRPSMVDSATHDRALTEGRIRYCPICDGYEVTDLDIAVLGTGERGYNEAMFLRSYSEKVTLVAPEEHNLSPEQRSGLSKTGIALASPCSEIRLAGAKIVLELDDGPAAFDTLYPALGSDIRSELAGQVGATHSEDGCLRVDAHQRTNVPGLYAAGDVVLGLDQISHAMGEGGVAATTIRNDLAGQTPLLR